MGQQTTLSPTNHIVRIKTKNNYTRLTYVYVVMKKILTKTTPPQEIEIEIEIEIKK